MKIGHYALGLRQAGGISTYIRRVSAVQQSLGHAVHFFDQLSSSTAGLSADEPIAVEDDGQLFAAASRLGLDVLHVHTLVKHPERSPMPILRTLHGHEPYCPSGGRFLGRWRKPCDRAYSVLGCGWGHVVDHCGSVRPGAMMAEFRRTHDEMEHTCRLPVLAVSDYLKREMVRNGYDAARIHVLRPPMPSEGEQSNDPPPRDGVPRFVFLGRLTPSKGADWLIESTARVRTPIQIDIAGEGNAEQDLRRLVSRLRIEDRVTFHGWVNGEVAIRLMRAARALVFPSLWQEPAGISALEAAGNARAVIASRVGGLPEMVIEEETAIVLEPGNVNALAGAMERLAVDWDLAARLGQEGFRAIPERFALGQHVDALMDFYRQCIAGRL